MLTEKEKGILDKTEDAIARKLDEVLESKEPIQDTTLSVVMDGIRIIDRIRLMRGGRYVHSDTSIQKDQPGQGLEGIIARAKERPQGRKGRQ